MSFFIGLVVVNIGCVMGAASNTVQGKDYYPHGFNLHKVFDSTLFTEKGLQYRKVALLCWALEVPLIVWLWVNA